MKDSYISFAKLHSIGTKSSSTYKVTSPSSSFVTTSTCSYCRNEESQFSISEHEGKKLMQQDAEYSWDCHITKLKCTTEKWREVPSSMMLRESRGSL
jgi:hypothetical protein